METVLLIIAGISSAIFGYKLFMLMFIGDGADLNSDIDADGGSDSFDLLSLQSVMTFLMSFSWASLAFIHELGFSIWESVGLGSVVGVLFTVAFMFSLYKMKKLASPPVSNIIIPIGTICEVYSTIPASGDGKVKVTHNGQIRYLKAYSEDKEYPTGSVVKVTKSYPLTIKGES